MDSSTSVSTFQVSNNSFSGCSKTDIYNPKYSIDLEGTLPSNALISGNTFKTNDYLCGGIIYKGPGTIEKNIFMGMGTLPGIYYQPSSNGTITIQKNIFINNMPAISALYWTAASTVIYNVNNNTFINNNSQNRLPTSGSYLDGPASVFNIATANSSTIGTYAGNFSQNLFFKNQGGSSNQSLINLFQATTNTANYTINNNNFIANTAIFNLYNLLPSGNAPNAQSNWWDTTNTTTIASKIFDGIDDNTYSNVNVSSELNAPNTSAPISPPQGVAVSGNGSGSVTLSWNVNPESDRQGYKIYYNTTGSYPWTASGATEGASGTITTASTSKTLTGLPTGQYYYFTVTAYDSGLDGTDDQTDGNESWFSDAVSMTIP